MEKLMMYLLGACIIVGCLTFLFFWAVIVIGLVGTGLGYIS